MLVNLNDVLKKAQREHYAVGLFNTIDTDMLQAAISAAEEMASPIIIKEISYATLEYPWLYNVNNLRSDIRFAVKAEFSLPGPRVGPESSIWTDRGNGTRDLVNDVLNGMVTAPAVLKETGADKTVFQSSD